MNDIDRILYLQKTYCNHTECSPSKPAKSIGQSGVLFTRLENGGDVNTKTKDALVGWFSENWPDDLDWPDGIHRPHNKDH